MACILLPLCFLYDIFWVFITPIIMGGKSVMVEVRTLTCFKSSLRDGAPLRDDAHWLCINAPYAAHYRAAVHATLGHPACDLSTAEHQKAVVSNGHASGVSQA